MKEYVIPRLEREDTIDFLRAPSANIDEYPWQTGNDYRPPARARLLFAEDTGLLLHMYCEETAPKAVYTRDMDPVYKDSCMEFFFSLDGESYVNCEMNANGALLCCYGASRGERMPAQVLTDTVLHAFAGKTKNGWYVRLDIPLSMLYKLYGRIDFSDGFTFYGNFYKCGDETAMPHYGAWNPVVSPRPDFHRPECFGKLILPPKNT